MSRLVDYFAIYGYNFDAASRRAEQACSGRLLQRFPEQSRPDVDFVANQEIFCQPCGWRLSHLAQDATYFVQTFTAESGQQCYSAMLSVFEPLTVEQRRQLFNVSASSVAASGEAGHLEPVPSSLSLADSDADAETVFVAAAALAEAAANGDQQQHQQQPPATVYAPKTLVLQSRHDLPETLRDCLVVLYAAHASGRREHLEQMIARLLSSVFVTTGSRYCLFSLLPGFDCQLIRPPPIDCCSVPVTGTVVASLFRQLGIHSCVKLVTALLTGCKVLLFSASFTLLTDACRALKALLYPFKYEYTLVPIMPKPLLDYVGATVPFLYGIHSSLKRHIEDCTESKFDLITADLDLGCVTENWSGCGGGQASVVTPLTEQVQQNLIADIIEVLHPGLATADRAFKRPGNPGGTLRSGFSMYTGDDFWLDKQIRAAFVRAFAEIVNGYRSCLSISRILPDNVISFHYASFLGGRGLIEDNFMRRLATESEMFCQFCQSRGPPYRRVDVFDELYDRLPELHAAEAAELLLPQLSIVDEPDDVSSNLSAKIVEVAAGRRLRRRHLDELARQLCECESLISSAGAIPEDQSGSQNVIVPQPSEDDLTSTMEPFPMLNPRLIGELIEAEEANRLVDDAMAAASGRASMVDVNENADDCSTGLTVAAKLTRSRSEEHQRLRQQKQTVPPGQRLEDLLLPPPSHQRLASSADIHRQKLQILELCVRHVFDRRIADAKKSLKAVKRDLAHRSSRLRLVDLLNDMVIARSMSTLDQQQFDIVCELLVQALRFDAQHEEWLCALRCLPLLERLRCQLPCQNSTELLASMTEEVQSCAAWSSEAFWHWAFSRFVQGQLRDYYVSRLAEWMPNEPVDPTATPLDIVAKVMRHSESISQAELDELNRIEEETVESAAKHFICILATLRMPLEPAKRRWASGANNRRDLGRISELSSTNQGHGGVGAGGSSQTESQESQQQQHQTAPQSQAEREANAQAAKASEKFARELEAWIRDRFLDRVCSENNLPTQRMDRLKKILHEFLHEAHLEMLDSIWSEYCKIPKSQKARITRPALLPGERALTRQLRAYLYPDGRRDPIRLQLESSESTTADYLQHQTLTMSSSAAAAAAAASGVASSATAEFTPDIGWLPAEGLFLATNYRLIFKGVPSNVLQSEKPVVRCFPIAALHKAKELGKSERDPALLPSVQNRHSVRQQVLFKSGTFEALKIGFDASAEEIQELLERIRTARQPSSVREYFALSTEGGRLVDDLEDEFADAPLQQSTTPASSSVAAQAAAGTSAEIEIELSIAGGLVKGKKAKKSHSKPYTLSRRIAKQTSSAAHAAANKLMTLRPGGASAGSHRHQQEHQWRSSLRPPPSPLADKMPASERASVLDTEHADVPIRAPGSSGATSRHHRRSRPTSELLLETLETPGYEDLRRLGLLNQRVLDAACLRICCANFEHDLVPSYPAVLIVPRAVADESLRRLGKAHRQSRFPAVVWRCHSNGALLFRAGSFQGKSLAWSGGGGGAAAAADGADVVRLSEEQERLFQSLAACAHASSLADNIIVESEPAVKVLHHSVAALSEGEESNVADSPAADADNSSEDDQFEDAQQGDEAASQVAQTPPPLPPPPQLPPAPTKEDNLSDIVASDFSSRRRRQGPESSGGPSSQLDRLFSSVRSGAAKLKKSDSLLVRRTTDFFATIRRKKQRQQCDSVKSRNTSRLAVGKSRIGADAVIVETDETVNEEQFVAAAAANFQPLPNRGRQWLTLGRSKLPSFNAKSLTLAFGSRSPAASMDAGIRRHLSSHSLDPAVGGEGGASQSIQLYIFADRSSIAKIRAHRLESAELIPIDEYPTVQAVRDSYKRLLKVCLPGKPLPLQSTTTSQQQKLSKKPSFFHAFEDTRWLNLVQCLLDLSGTIVNLIACQARSVLVALEDGWDATAAVLSLAQLMLDQHYRTIAGFRSLLEKDWLLFGHQFDSRFGRLKGPESNQFSPVFLLFLDAVHQLLHQFPLSFEFNQQFMLTLAYHTVSCRFANFLGNCEADRLYADIGDADFWAYLDSQMEASTAYLNLAFCPDSMDLADESSHARSRKQKHQQQQQKQPQSQPSSVLRPVTEQAILQRWAYFTREEAAYGASADPDLYSQERRWHLAASEAKSAASALLTTKDAGKAADDSAVGEQSKHGRQQLQHDDDEVELGYNYYPGETASSLGSAIESFAELNGIDCREAWRRLLRPTGRGGRRYRRSSQTNFAERWHIEHSHQLLDRAFKTSAVASSTTTSTTTATTTSMSTVGLKTPPMRPPPPQLSSLPATRLSTSPQASPGVEDPAFEYDEETVQEEAEPEVRPLPERPPPPRLPTTRRPSNFLESTLHKQGKLLRQWTARQFLLDPVRHQLRYWDGQRDPSGQRPSELSLAEVKAVRLTGRAPSGAPHKVPDGAFFELHLTRSDRVIRLYANTPKLATEWVERLNSAISQ